MGGRGRKGGPGERGGGGGDEWAGGVPVPEACPRSSSQGLEGRRPGGEMRTGGEKVWRRRGERGEDSAVAVSWCGGGTPTPLVLGGASGGLCLGVKRTVGGAAPRLLALSRSRGGAVLGSLGGRDAQDDSIVSFDGSQACVVEQGVVLGGFDQWVGLDRESGENVSCSGSPLKRRIASGNVTMLLFSDT